MEMASCQAPSTNLQAKRHSTQDEGVSGGRGFSSRPWSGSQVSHQSQDCHIDHQESRTEEFTGAIFWHDVACNRIVVTMSSTIITIATNDAASKYQPKDCTKCDRQLVFSAWKSLVVFQTVPVPRLFSLVNVPLSQGVRVITGVDRIIVCVSVWHCFNSWIKEKFLSLLFKFASDIDTGLSSLMLFWSMTVWNGSNHFSQHGQCQCREGW